MYWIDTKRSGRLFLDVLIDEKVKECGKFHLNSKLLCDWKLFWYLLYSFSQRILFNKSAQIHLIRFEHANGILFLRVHSLTLKILRHDNMHAMTMCVVSDWWDLIQISYKKVDKTVIERNKKDKLDSVIGKNSPSDTCYELKCATWLSKHD